MIIVGFASLWELMEDFGSFEGRRMWRMSVRGAYNMVGVDVFFVLHEMADTAMILAKFGRFLALAFWSVGDRLWNVISMALMTLHWCIWLKGSKISLTVWASLTPWQLCCALASLVVVAGIALTFLDDP